MKLNSRPPHRPLPARHRRQHRHDPAPRRLPRARRRHHRAGRLRSLRPRAEARRHGLSRNGGADPASRLRALRGMAARRRPAAGAVLDQGRDSLTPAFAFADGDILLFGRESAGVPDHVHDAADARLIDPDAGRRPQPQRRARRRDGGGRSDQADRLGFEPRARRRQARPASADGSDRLGHDHSGLGIGASPSICIERRIA